MSTLKGLLFNQYATEALSALIEEMQSKYSPKKGRRFNHENITYEVSRPTLIDNCIEFEISSKIPENEFKNPKEMQSFYEKIKKLLAKGKNKPVSVAMENIAKKSAITSSFNINVRWMTCLIIMMWLNRPRRLEVVVTILHLDLPARLLRPGVLCWKVFVNLFTSLVETV